MGLYYMLDQILTEGIGISNLFYVYLCFYVGMYNVLLLNWLNNLRNPIENPSICQVYGFFIDYHFEGLPDIWDPTVP